MRIAFLGTPSFARVILQALTDGGHTLCVITQPDKPVGRKAKLTPPPVKVTALEHGLPIFQFSRVSDEDGVAMLRGFHPDFLITAAYGQKLSKDILSIPRIAPLNVHASLLPKYRGASPIQSCIINGDSETGVSVMRMVERMDAGAVYSAVSTPIYSDETADELSERLSALGAALLLDTLPKLAAGELEPVEQDETRVTTCRKLTRESGRVDFLTSAGKVHDLVRGSNSWPGAYAMLDGTPLKVYRTREIVSPQMETWLPGRLFRTETGGLGVVCGQGAVELLEVQYAGGKRMDGASFLRGHATVTESVLV